jgi:hypothetical protein
LKPIRLDNEALTELGKAASWYEERGAGLGRRFLDSVELSLAQLADFPSLGGASTDCRLTCPRAT